MTSDNLGNHYTYNVYGRPATVNSTTAIYDAFSRLVEMQGSSTTQIAYAPDGWKFAYMSGQTVEKYIAPLTAGLQAVYNAATPAPPAYWRHADWLGSERLASNANQTVNYDGAYAPFGENYAESGAGFTRDRNFTGQTQDMTSGLYEFTFRQQSASQGRWLVPDPAGLAAVDMTNPQTWNRYAYVANNPLSNVDPLGLILGVGDGDCDPVLGCGTLGCGGVGWLCPTPPPIIIPPCVFAGDCGGHKPPPCDSCGNGNPPPSQPPSAPQPLNSGDETLGIPSNLQHPWGTWSALIPTGNCGDLGPCIPFGFGFDGSGPLPLGTWGKIELWFACVAGLDPAYAKPMTVPTSGPTVQQQPGPPNQSTDSPPGTEGQRDIYGPNGRGQPVPYNPTGSGSQLPDAVAGGPGYLAGVIECIHNVNTAWPKK